MRSDLPDRTDSVVEGNTIGPEDFYEQALENFESAEEKMDGPVDRFFLIGGFHVRLRFAGPALIPPLTRAIMHLAEEEPGEVDLTVCLWDSASTGIRMIPPPWKPADNGLRGEIRGFNTPTVQTTFNLGPGVLSLLHRQRDLALYWTRDASQLPYYETGAPLLTILNWWMSARGRQIVHAGAVGNSKGAVLLVGRSGSGKSSTSLSCLAAGLLYLSDDYCMVSRDPEPFVYSVFSSGKVNPEDARLFPSLGATLSNAMRLGPEKALFFLNEKFADRVVTGLPLKAVLIPKIVNRPDTRLVKVSSSASLLALAPSTIFQLPGAGHEVFDCLGGLANVLPSYTLELGSDRARIPSVISQFLSEGKS